MADGATGEKIERIRNVPSLEALYQEAAALNMTPGWLRRQETSPHDAPQSAFAPAHWRYDECKAALDAAGRLIDVSLAERRNLGLRNPALKGPGMWTTRTLVSAYQMILPGEKAPSHRHTAHALRVIIDGKGSYSTVDNEKTPMETGDVVLTPGWCWHEHGHDGDEPAYWLDGLDVPLVNGIEAQFYEENPERYATNPKAVTKSPYRFTQADIHGRLDKATADNEGFHGPQIVLEAPTMPTMLLTVQRLPSGMKTRRQRSTTNRVFCCMEGSGESVIGDQRFTWNIGDAFIAPLWTWFEHKATSDAQLFEMSDEPLMKFARYHRHEAA